MPCHHVNLGGVRAVEIRHLHLFAGLGGGAAGFNRGEARVGGMQARFRCIGGIDIDPAAMRDFARLAGAPGAARHWPDVLGVDRTASRDDITAAYRRLRGLTHPDKGGDAAAFDAIERIEVYRRGLRPGETPPGVMEVLLRAKGGTARVLRIDAAGRCLADEEVGAEV